MRDPNFDPDVMSPRTFLWGLLDHGGVVAGMFILFGWAMVTSGYETHNPTASTLHIVLGVALTIAGPSFFYLTPNMARWSQHPDTTRKD